jgi:hypothetical protein
VLRQAARRGFPAFGKRIVPLRGVDFRQHPRFGSNVCAAVEEPVWPAGRPGASLSIATGFSGNAIGGLQDGHWQFAAERLSNPAPQA